MDPKYIRVASDLHLEAFINFPMEKLIELMLPEDERDKDSLLMLAGDICSEKYFLIDFIKHIEDRFFKVHFLPGNHEYYRHTYDQWNRTVLQMAGESLKNSEVTTDGIELHEYYRDDGSDHFRIIQGTLWGDGGKSLFEHAMVGRYLNDFRLIGYQGQHYEVRDFKVSDMIEIHKEHREMIECFLDDPEWKGKTIVATHHMPSYTLCHPRFGFECNGGFASDCDYLIDQYQPDVWIHGHTHDTIDTKIANTRIVCNPRGYRGEWGTEFNTYSPLFIEI